MDCGKSQCDIGETPWPPEGSNYWSKTYSQGTLCCKSNEKGAYIGGTKTIRGPPKCVADCAKGNNGYNCCTSIGPLDPEDSTKIDPRYKDNAVWCEQKSEVCIHYLNGQPYCGKIN